MKKVLMKGNDAIAEAAVRAGCRFYFGYPITPQTEISEYFSWRLPEVGGVFLQAESEIAAVYMCYGVSATGERVMTSSSGPGISLKQEGISYLACAELPCVIVNINRAGPGLGNISPSQSDYFQAVKGGGHGDYRVLVLAPSTVQEMVDHTYLAFHLADTYRNPVLILSDGMLGQMMEPVVFRDYDFPPPPPKQWAVRGKDGHQKKIILPLNLDPLDLERVNLRLAEKYRRVEEHEVRFECFGPEEADLLLIGYGTSARVLRSVVRAGDQLGLRLRLVRPISLYPFPAQAIREEARRAGRVLVLEMNLGQMVEDVRLAIEGQVPVHFHGRTGGVIPTVDETLEKVHQVLGDK